MGLGKFPEALRCSSSTSCTCLKLGWRKSSAAAPAVRNLSDSSSSESSDVLGSPPMRGTTATAA